jgi:hypothetical protein
VNLGEIMEKSPKDFAINKVSGLLFACGGPTPKTGVAKEDA